MKYRNKGISLPLLWKLCLAALLWLITAQGNDAVGGFSSPCLARTPSPSHSEKTQDASAVAQPSPTGKKEAETVKTTPEETPEDGRLMSPDPSESEQVNWIDDAKQGTKSDKEVQSKFYKRLWLTFVSLIIITVVTYLALRYIYAKQGLLPNALKTPSKMIRVVERQMLQPQKAIYLVDVAGKYILIGISENRMEYLTEIDRDLIDVRVSEMEHPTQANLVSLDKYPLPKPFSQLLEKMQNRKGDGESTPM